MVSSEGSQRKGRLTRDKVCRVEGGRVQEEDRVGRIILMYHCDVVAVAAVVIVSFVAVVVSESVLVNNETTTTNNRCEERNDFGKLALPSASYPSHRYLSTSRTFPK